MIGAGLLARNAVARGLRVGPSVKTSLAPGSRAVTGYLEAAGLMAPLEALGFALAGYGCTTCIGNSGPLDEAVAGAVEANDLVVAAVLSGQPQLRGPDPSAGPGELPRLPAPGRRLRPGRPGRHGPDDRTARLRWRRRPVFLADIWPSAEEIREVIGSSIDPELFRSTYATVFDGDDRWRALPIPSGDRYAWSDDSTYIAKPPFFDGLSFDADAGPRHRRCARPRRPGRLGHDRPHLARPGRSRRPRPPASGSRRTGSVRSSSTRTAPAAASTK